MRNRFLFTVSKFFIIVCCFCLAAAATVQSAEGKPHVLLESDTYDFGLAFEGSDVTHDFTVKNSGDADLEIQKVKAGWGCTTVSFDRLISPGAEGKITVKFSTKGRKGKNSKSIRVETNDTENAKFNLKLTGEVKQFVTTIRSSTSSVPRPHMIVLRGTAGEKISEVFAVGSGTAEPLRILHSDTLNQDNFRYSMTEIEIEGKPAHQFLVENIKTSAGNYQDKLFIFTDNAQFNPITISVRGDIRPAETENQKAANDLSAPDEVEQH